MQRDCLVSFAILYLLSLVSTFQVEIAAFCVFVMYVYTVSIIFLANVDTLSTEGKKDPFQFTSHPSNLQ